MRDIRAHLKDLRGQWLAVFRAWIQRQQETAAPLVTRSAGAGGGGRMPREFPASGNIEPASFPHLLVDLHRHGATGSLKVTGPLHPKALYFRGGRILFGSSMDPRDQLGTILIESGHISREQLDEVNAKMGPGNPLAKVLAESGFVDQRELLEAAWEKVERILSDVLSWEAGSFEFEGHVLPKGAVDLNLPTERLLLAAIKRIRDRAFALRHVDTGAVLEPSPEGAAVLSEVWAGVVPLFEHLDGRRSLKEAISLSRLDEFEATKIACAILLLGVVRRKDAVATSATEEAKHSWNNWLARIRSTHPSLFDDFARRQRCREYWIPRVWRLMESIERSIPGVSFACFLRAVEHADRVREGRYLFPPTWTMPVSWVARYWGDGAWYDGWTALWRFVRKGANGLSFRGYLTQCLAFMLPRLFAWCGFWRVVGWAKDCRPRLGDDPTAVVVGDTLFDDTWHGVPSKVWSWWT
jgi:hypothetical protein